MLVLKYLPCFIICWASSSAVWLPHVSLQVNGTFYFFLHAFVSEPSFYALYTHQSAGDGTCSYIWGFMLHCSLSVEKSIFVQAVLTKDLNSPWTDKCPLYLPLARRIYIFLAQCWRLNVISSLLLMLTESMLLHCLMPL